VNTIRGPAFSTKLLTWYDREQRALPWRRKPSAYHTLVSELMLQQTGVATVVPYFERFVARFSTLRALAAAKEDEVLALWSGLGYYSRARNLHRTARMVVEEMGGELPANEEDLRKLPGIGAYTAAAVAAIAFSQRTLPVDGNVARVLARLLGERRSIDRPVVRAGLGLQGLPLVPSRRPGDFAQAMMELGARCCLPHHPTCPLCPVSRFCRARAEGTTVTIPARSKRPKKRHIHLVCVAVERRGQLLLVQRPVGALLARTWTLPLQELQPNETVDQAGRRTLTEMGLRLQGPLTPLGEIRAIFTHRDATALVLRARTSGKLRRSDSRWVRAGEWASLALSTFSRKTLELTRTKPFASTRGVRG
jgi:A/G-specific adenine glycosylase